MRNLCPRPAAMLLVAGLACAASPEERIAAKAKLAARMRQLHVPAVSVAVMENGKIAWAKAYGDTVNTETMFQAGSISESVAAMAALHMAQFGNFTLDEDVNGKLKSWKVPDKTVTLRMILSHSAEPAVPGGGFTVMRQLLLDRIGWTFPQIMQRMVLGRIGMTHSTYEQPLPPETKAAGLWTTPSDLALWAIELRAEYLGRSNKVLEQRTAREMLTRQKGDWGLGVQLGGEAASFHFAQAGSNTGFRCRIVMLVDSGNGAVVMTNGDLGDALVNEIIEAAASEYAWPQGWKN